MTSPHTDPEAPYELRGRRVPGASGMVYNYCRVCGALVRQWEAAFTWEEWGMCQGCARPHEPATGRGSTGVKHPMSESRYDGGRFGSGEW